jgi:hypothetical protein
MLCGAIYGARIGEVATRTDAQHRSVAPRFSWTAISADTRPRTAAFDNVLASRLEWSVRPRPEGTSHASRSLLAGQGIRIHTFLCRSGAHSCPGSSGSEVHCEV